ncbi:MAG: DUF4935 domain-containing protein [gamma proteobacterium endosymbiont of Lamellibrachia anaximandri]|nr:DUF4935 domain-containing protein [gamma proteobacterium endosymbiont of Lamellibrachia anaximandri]MBL3619655.1 DUF4935 domain-containing protein [gamma proteobacterium endosymbiont of Lamellibrachia anaximandri]
MSTVLTSASTLTILYAVSLRCTAYKMASYAGVSLNTMNKNPLPRQFCVLLDTNTWRSNLLLRTSIGSALLYTLNVSKGKLALPEINEIEIFKHTQQAGEDAKRKIDRYFRDIQSIMGERSAYTLPSADQIKNKIQARLDELSDLVIRVPFTLSHAKSSLIRVNDEVPPSATKKQQFKDCAIWESILDLLNEYDVHMVTNDGDFFKSKGASEIASILRDEIKHKEGKLELFRSLSQCLESLQEQRPEIDLAAVARMIVDDKFPDIEKSLAVNNLRPTIINTFEIKTFITEEHNRLAINYYISIDAINTDITPVNQYSPASGFIEGNCYFNTDTNLIEDNIQETIGAQWIDANGEEKGTKGIWLRSAAGTKKSVPYAIRRELE